MTPRPKTRKMTRIEKAARKLSDDFFRWMAECKQPGESFNLPGKIAAIALSERSKALRGAAEIAHAEAIQNKAAALRARLAGRPGVAEFRESDGDACGRVEEKILSLSNPGRGKR